MSHDYVRYVNELKDSIRERANEIANRLSKDDIDSIHQVLELIDELDSSLDEFDSIIHNAWEDIELF